MKRLTGRLGKMAERFLSTITGAPDARSGETLPAAAKPLAMTFRATEEAAAATEQLFAQARKIEDCLSDIREEVGLAWQEQSRASQEYYDLARGILLALDDLRELSAGQPALGDLAARLEVLLREHDMLAIPVATGDAFCADIHVCNRTEPSGDMRCRAARAGGRLARLPPPAAVRRTGDRSTRPGCCQPIAP